MSPHTRALGRAFALFLFTLVGVAACGTDFEPGSRVVDFRLLAVAADKPFAAPGETVRLTTLHHEPFGRPLTWAWTTCPLPHDSTVNGCLARLAELARTSAAPPFTVEQGRSSFEVTIPPDILDGIPEEAKGNAIVGVVTIVCPGNLSLKDLADIRSSQLPFRCIEAGTGVELAYERYAVAVKRIYLYSRDKNQNPAIADVTWDGASWPEGEIKEARVCDFDSNSFEDCKGERHEISVNAVPATAETGTSEYGTPFREDVVIQHYATEGVFEYDVKTLAQPKTRWAARARSRGQTITMWFVIRDNRGGVTWTSRQVRAL
ncbi:MAG: hypothetical protein BGO98_27410 [Myxococcales bacterium 68-20]|nr:hypothetical protein [Myxococcales bacterium]OJY30452.1 MAG: hypothetical protein BGO98_27410 [Myxococcales bacterium 68-20]